MDPLVASDDRKGGKSRSGPRPAGFGQYRPFADTVRAGALIPSGTDGSRVENRATSGRPPSLRARHPPNCLRWLCGQSLVII
jgi:hypothetical protein